MQCSNKCDFCIWLLHTAWRIPLIIMVDCCVFFFRFTLAHRWIHSYAFTWYLVLLTCLTQCAIYRWVCKTHRQCQCMHRIRGKTIAIVDMVSSLESWVQVIFFLGKSRQYVHCITPHVIQLTSDHRHHASRRLLQPSIIIQIKWTYWDMRFAVKINYDDRTICLVNSDWCQSVVDS